ncbi:MAG: glycosyltransferase [Armatimonadota bacterium]
MSGTPRTRIAIIGGGSGGHVYPALAVAMELRALCEEVEVWLATGRKPVEKEWTAGTEPEPVRLFSAPVPYGLRPLALARAVGAAGAGTLQTLSWWWRWHPQAMLTFGGYVSVPAALAARAARVPYAYHAADALPDRSARTLARRARLVTVNYPEAAEAFPGVTVEAVGQPLRQWLFGTSREEAAQALGLDPERTTLVVLGGSQGAHSLNQAAAAAGPRLLRESEIQVLHVTGSLDYREVCDGLAEARIPADRYRVLSFLREMDQALALADIALTRCGANSLAELAVAGAALIMVPYPYAGGHQRYNAEPLQRVGAGVIVEDVDLTANRLAEETLSLVRDENLRHVRAEAARRWAKPDAACKVAELTLRIAGEKP